MYKFILLILILTFSKTGLTQEPQFSLQRSLPQLANTAFTGTSNFNRLAIGTYYLPIAKNIYYLTSYVGYDQYVDKLHGGLGAEISQSVFGNLHSHSINQFMVNYAYHQRLTSKFKLSVGLGGGISTRFDRFNLIDSLGSILGDTAIYRSNFRWKAGVLVHSENFYFGLQYIPAVGSKNNLYQFDYDLFKGFIGGDLRPFKNKNLSLSPSMLYTTQDGFQSMTLQLAFATQKFALGVNSTNLDNLGGFGAMYFDKFDIKYNFNRSFSPLSWTGKGGHELIFNYKFKSKNNISATSFTPKLF